MSLLAWLGIGQQRREERAAFLTAIRAMETVATKAAETAALQSQAVQSILESFKTSSPPDLREYDDASTTKRYLERTYGPAIANMKLPSDLQTLHLADQYQALLDTLDA